MKNNIVDKVMQVYFKYLGIANIIFYIVYLVNYRDTSIGAREVIFTIIASMSMVLVPVLYLVIMTKKGKSQNIHIYLNIITITMCFDILLLSLGSKFSFIYLIKSILASIIIFTPIRIIMSSIMSLIISIPKKLITKNVSN